MGTEGWQENPQEMLFPLCFHKRTEERCAQSFGMESDCLLNLAVVEAQANCRRKQKSCSGAHAKAKSPVRNGRCLFACLAHRNKLFYFNWEINDQNMVFDVILAIFWSPGQSVAVFITPRFPLTLILF